MFESRARPIDAATRLCGVYGHPIRHSASPAMQNAGIAALGLNWRYLAFEVHPNELQAAIAGAKAMKFVGLNLTVPHKVLAATMVDVLDDSARDLGAVNTISFEGRSGDGSWIPLGQWHQEPLDSVRTRGFNTDADAMVRSLTEELNFKPLNAQVLLLGTGGAGRVAALQLASEGITELFLVNRTSAKANDLALEIRRRFPRLKVSLGFPKHGVDLLVNATSVGLNQDDRSPLDEKAFPIQQAKAVFDVIYRPAETALLRSAKRAGCQTANGLGMLLYQGAKALEIWSGKAAPLSVMRQALERSIYV